MQIISIAAFKSAEKSYRTDDTSVDNQSYSTSEGSQSYTKNQSLESQSDQTNKSSISQSYQTNQSFGSQSNQTNQSLESQSDQTNKSSISQSDQTSISVGSQSDQTSISVGNQSNPNSISVGNQSNPNSISVGNQSNPNSISVGNQSYKTNQSLGNQSYTNNQSSISQSNQTNKSFGSQSNQTNQSLESQSDQTNKSSISQSDQTSISVGNQSYKTNQSFGSQSNQTNKSFGSQSNQNKTSDTKHDKEKGPFLEMQEERKQLHNLRVLCRQKKMQYCHLRVKPLREFEFDGIEYIMYSIFIEMKVKFYIKDAKEPVHTTRDKFSLKAFEALVRLNSAEKVKEMLESGFQLVSKEHYPPDPLNPNTPKADLYNPDELRQYEKTFEKGTKMNEILQKLGSAIEIAIIKDVKNENGEKMNLDEIFFGDKPIKTEKKNVLKFIGFADVRVSKTTH